MFLWDLGWGIVEGGEGLADPLAFRGRQEATVGVWVLGTSGPSSQVAPAPKVPRGRQSKPSQLLVGAHNHMKYKFWKLLKSLRQLCLSVLFTLLYNNRDLESTSYF